MRARDNQKLFRINFMRTTDNNRNIASEDVSISEEFIKKIANKELSELQSEDLFLFPPRLDETDDLSAEQMILESNSNVLKTTNIMGIIGHNDEQLFIGSRFDRQNNYFFYYMIKKVMNINIVNKDVDVELKKGYLDILIFLFPRYLNLALRKGLLKEYQHRHHNDSNIKGKIDFKRYLKENSPFTGKVTYTTREFSYDKPVINLIRYTIEFIKTRKEFRGVLSDDDVTRNNVKQIEEHSFNYRKFNILTVIQYNLKKPVRHGYYFEYRTLQLLCLAILRANESMYKKSTENKVYGILFDGSWLFDEYVNLLIKDAYIHPQNKTGEGRQYLFEKSIGLIYPDFISRNSVDRTVADAKYKRYSVINGRDYLQLVAYMYRFDSKRGYFIYPKSYNDKKEPNESLFLKHGTDKHSVERDDEISVRKVGIRIHYDALTFEEFERRMSEEEMKFRHEIGLKIP